MSDVFGNYAAYYNLLYKEKDYSGETEYVLSLLDKYAAGADSILELGCGTGKHARLLAETGKHVCGVDMSESMLEQAELQKADLAQGSLDFHHCDIRTFKKDEKFDAAISLFHVMSYQTDDHSLHQALTTARTHLKEGGLFIMDCWYGPAVLNEEPEIRIRRLEDEHIHVTRIAEPVHHRDKKVVDVHFDLFIRDKKNNSIEELTEKHPMRYFTVEELEAAFEKAGFKMEFHEEWLSGKPLSAASWSAVFGGRCI